MREGNHYELLSPLVSKTVLLPVCLDITLQLVVVENCSWLTCGLLRSGGTANIDMNLDDRVKETIKTSLSGSCNLDL